MHAKQRPGSIGPRTNRDTIGELLLLLPSFLSRRNQINGALSGHVLLDTEQRVHTRTLTHVQHTSLTEPAD